MQIQQNINHGIFHPRRLGHVNLFVSNLDKAVSFYNKVAGLEVVYVRPPVAAGFFSNGNTHHDIGVVQYVGRPTLPQHPGLNHLGFEFEHEKDLVESFYIARETGIEFQRAADHVIARAIYLGDPNRNQVELYADSIKDWRSARTGVVTRPTIPWKPGEEEPSTESNYTPDPEIRRVEDAIFHPLRVTHATLVVDDYPTVVDYYVKMIGLTPLTGDRDSPFCILAGACGTESLALFPASSNKKQGLHHAGFVVRNEADLEASKRKAVDASLAIEADVENECRRAILVRDPDGLQMQFYVDRDKGPAGLGKTAPELALLLS